MQQLHYIRSDSDTSRRQGIAGNTLELLGNPHHAYLDSWVRASERLYFSHATHLTCSATGFVGLPVAQAFVRGGHVVYGLARSPEKARLLSAEESAWSSYFNTINRSHAHPSAQSCLLMEMLRIHHTWIHLVASVDVVVDILRGTPEETPQQSVAAIDAVTDAAQRLRPAGSPKM